MSSLPPFVTNLNQPLDILGKGAKFPYEINEFPENYAGTKSQYGLDKIRESIAQIMGTPYGSRVMNREFGCKIWSLIFEPNDEIFASLGTYFIAEALDRWEKRVILNTVNFDTSPYLKDNSTVYITVYFTVIQTQVQGNYVFPFYTGTPPIR